MAKQHLQKVLDHAEKRLRSADGEATPSRAELIKLYKRFLKVEQHRIRMLHKAGGGGTEIARRRSDLLDVVIDNLFVDSLAAGNGRRGNASASRRDSGKEPRITIVATGGYGRGQLNPGSDVDLLFLHPHSGRTLPSESSEIVEQILYMLWDVGFQVGHATRSIKETIKQANMDNQTKCALIESRLVTGDEALYEEFRRRFHKECIQGKEKRFLAARAADQRARHAKYSNTVYLQEPNVKNGCGGLRDYQSLLWIIYVKRQTRELKDLVDEKMLTPSAYRELEKGFDFLMRVRNTMHYEERRATDTLSLRLQGVVATRMGYPQKTMLRRTEIFMRDYYLHTRDIFHHTTSVMQSFELEERDEQENSGIVSFLALRKREVEHFDGFYSKGSFIYPENSQVFEEDPRRLIRLFQHAQRRHLRLSPRIRKVIKESYSLIDRPFRYSKANRETFESILSSKGDVARVLRQMHRVDVLGRYLPEFGALTCLVQHEFFHRYTADEHTLLCIEKLDELSDTDDPRLKLFQSLFHDLEDPCIFYLGLILHDTGRARNYRYHADASTLLADKVATRLRISGERRRRLLFLVDHHLTFWRTATTKNIEDPNTIAEFAGIIKNRSNLEALLLFTYVDSNSTNETAWSGWKESLILELFHSTASYFQDQEAFKNQVHPAISELKEEVAARLGAGFDEEIQAQFANMPERYFRFRSAETVSGHIRGFRKFFEVLQKNPEASLTPVLHWKARPDGGHSELEVYSWDRPLLLARVAGALAARNINILAADIFTRRDSLVLDIFKVCTTNFEPVTSRSDIQAVSTILDEAFSRHAAEFRSVIEKARRRPTKYQEIDAPDFPKRVYIANDVNPVFTVLGIQTLDRIGLLYDVFSVLGESEVEVVAARINTEKGAAIDSFFLSDSLGRKIADQALLSSLKKRLEVVLGIGQG